MPLAPLDPVDLLLNLQRLEIVELGFVRLKLGVEFVFTSLLLIIDQRGPRHAAVAGRHTASLRSNKTTRPPLSPVAR